MNAKRQVINWGLDALLLAGFIAAMLLDLTGLGLHQWLGLAIPALAAVHLIRHWQWVKTVSVRLLRAAPAAQRYYVVDAALLAGFLSIALTGLVISTWFNLALTDYPAWRAAHVTASVGTLALVVVKVGLHWRWIVSTARQKLRIAPVALPDGTLQPAPVTVDRRDFIGLMGAVGVAALFAGTQALTGSAAPAESTETSVANTVGSTSGAACAVACNRRCAYPGECRRYVGSNGNGKCELGECATDSATSAVESATGSAVAPSAAGNTATVCQVACNRRCSYPGHCRRYTDLTGNGACDLGECGSGSSGAAGDGVNGSAAG